MWPQPLAVGWLCRGPGGSDARQGKRSVGHRGRPGAAAGRSAVADCGADGMTWKIVTSNDLAKRFFAKVSFEPMSGCWLWIGALNRCKYGVFGVRNSVYLAHRISWEMANGRIPENIQIDHICHNPSCVNPDHLRLATHSENMWNSHKRKNNTSGEKGVTWSKSANAWIASIWAFGIRKHLGVFKTVSQAHEAYVKAAKLMHGKFMNGGDAA